MSRFTHRVSPFALATLSAIILAGSLSSAQAFDLNPQYPKIGKFKATNRSVWDMWKDQVRRDWLGSPIADETATQFKGTNVSVMTFRRGVIVKHLSGQKEGKTFMVYGNFRDLFLQAKYLQGPLGCPISNRFQYEGRPAQGFQGGWIRYDQVQQKYIVVEY